MLLCSFMEYLTPRHTNSSINSFVVVAQFARGRLYLCHKGAKLCVKMYLYSIISVCMSDFSENLSTIFLKCLNLEKI